ncbi:unnamed protein product [Heligmosomoides polygyrus]|uniref:Uncharacterized protein n=1 Tax=Heligmosomoides polygyrus TaxID=6339 RepID=A0A183GI28_HELPZ|nr:unnamed protein product [Heligmosomoides polygyrus]
MKLCYGSMFNDGRRLILKIVSVAKSIAKDRCFPSGAPFHYRMFRLDASKAPLSRVCDAVEHVASMVYTTSQAGGLGNFPLLNGTERPEFVSEPAGPSCPSAASIFSTSSVICTVAHYVAVTMFVLGSAFS